MKRIFVLHEYGAPTHYHALRVLARQHGQQVVFRIFDCLLDRAIVPKVKLAVRHPICMLQSICFLLTLPLRKPTKIVLGIAPFNRHLPFLMKLLRKHQVYYHTSYSRWDGTRWVHQPSSAELVSLWKNFTSQYVQHIFSVSEWTKNQLTKNAYATADRISVVNHSYTRRIDADANLPKKNSFLCVSSLTEWKGIPELLNIFTCHPEADITFVGKGPLKGLVESYSQRFPNISYAGYVQGAANIMPIYARHSFLLLNSQRTDSWEELFGMVIIEAMACGCVPITTDHPGPTEILANGTDGIICKEGAIEKGITKAIGMDNQEYANMRRRAIEKGHSYHCDLMADRWAKIFS